MELYSSPDPTHCVVICLWWAALGYSVLIYIFSNSLKPTTAHLHGLPLKGKILAAKTSMVRNIKEIRKKYWSHIRAYFQKFLTSVSKSHICSFNSHLINLTIKQMDGLTVAHVSSFPRPQSGDLVSCDLDLVFYQWDHCSRRPDPPVMGNVLDSGQATQHIATNICRNSTMD